MKKLRVVVTANGADDAPLLYGSRGVRRSIDGEAAAAEAYAGASRGGIGGSGVRRSVNGEAAAAVAYAGESRGGSGGEGGIICGGGTGRSGIEGWDRQERHRGAGAAAASRGGGGSGGGAEHK